MVRRNRTRRNRGFKGQHIVTQYATYTTGSRISIIAKQLGIPPDRPCKPLWLKVKFICDSGIAYTSTVVIDGNREVCARSTQQMVTTFPTRTSLRVFRGTDYDHYSPTDAVVDIDVLFQTSLPPKVLSVQAVICVAIGPRNVNAYGFNHVQAEPLTINDEAGVSAPIMSNQHLSQALSSLGSSFRRLSL